MTDAAQPSQTPREIGAWALFSCTHDPAATLALCRKLGVTFLDVMINDGSRDHLAPVKFDVFDEVQLRKACAYWAANGLSFGFTSWASPRPEWLAGMHGVGLMATDCGARSVTLDLEEPWLVPMRKLGLGERAQATADLVSNLRVTFAGEIGVTHIVYAPTDIIGQALALCDADVPQCYSTRTNAGALKPGSLERTTVARWGPFDKPITMGVAGWSQEGAYGLGYLQAFRASLVSARALGSDRCRVWRLDAIDQHEARILREVWL